MAGVKFTERTGIAEVSLMVNDNNTGSYYGRGPVKEIALDKTFLQSPEKDKLEFSVVQLITSGRGKPVQNVHLGKSSGGVWIAALHINSDTRRASFSPDTYDAERVPYNVEKLVQEGYVHLTKYGHIMVVLDTFLTKDVLVKFSQTSYQLFDEPNKNPLVPYVHLVPTEEEKNKKQYSTTTSGSAPNAPLTAVNL